MMKNSGFLISEERIKQRISEIARQIEADYAGKIPVLVGILKGSFVFLADLMGNCEWIWKSTFWVYRVMENLRKLQG